MSVSTKISVSSLINVPETMLIPLYLKAKETREKGIIRDDKSVEIAAEIDYDFSKIARDWKTQIGVVVRTYLFDKMLASLAEKYKDLVVVNLGAGLDTRQERFSDLIWYQLDLPESMAIRNHFFQDENVIAKSVFDFSWIDDIKENNHIVFIAEGVFMYFSEAEVKSIFLEISKRFADSYLLFNTIHVSAVGKKHASVNTDKAPMKWGIVSAKEIEEWDTGWQISEEVYPLDYYKSRWGWMRLLNLVPSFKKGYMIALMHI